MVGIEENKKRWAANRERRGKKSYMPMVVQLCEAGTIKVSNDDMRPLRDYCQGNKCEGCFKNGQTSFDI